MKLLISLVVLLVAIGTVSAQCNSNGLRCVDVGESCPRDFVDPYTICKAGSYCYYSPNPQTVDEPGNCTAYAMEGEYCDNDDDYWICAPGLSCYANEYSPFTCQYLYYAAIGESCDSAISCANENECINGKCQLAASNDGYCSQRWDDCAFGLACNYSSESCTPTLEEGADCSDENLVCGVGLTCSPTNTNRNTFQCVPISSKGAGAACSNTYYSFGEDILPLIDCDASQNLVCYRDNSGDLTCQTPPSLTSGNCTANGCDNGNYEYCACPLDSSTGSCVAYTPLGSECGDNIKNIAKCAVEHECQAYSSVSYSYKSCLYQHCSSYLCNDKCSSANLNDESCGTFKPEGCYANSSSFVRPTLFLAIIAFAALLF